MTDDVKNERDLELLAIQAIMSTKDGRHFIHRVLERAGIDVTSYDDNPQRHARNSGQRELGLWVLDEVRDAAFGSYIKMLEEHNNDR